MARGFIASPLTLGMSQNYGRPIVIPTVPPRTRIDVANKGWAIIAPKETRLNNTDTANATPAVAAEKNAGRSRQEKKIDRMIARGGRGRAGA